MHPTAPPPDFGQPGAGFLPRGAPGLAAHRYRANCTGGAWLVSLAWGAGDPQRGPDLGEDAGRVDPLLRAQVVDRAVVHEAIGQRDLVHRHVDPGPVQRVEHAVTEPAHR